MMRFLMNRDEADSNRAPKTRSAPGVRQRERPVSGWAIEILDRTHDVLDVARAEQESFASFDIPGSAVAELPWDSFQNKILAAAAVDSASAAQTG